MTPRAALEITKNTTNVFRVAVTLGEDGDPIDDLTGWSNFWFQAKRRYSDDDDDALVTKVWFDGVEIVDEPNGILEVTILPADTSSLDQGIRENLIGAVGGLDADLNPHEFLTLQITAYPRVRRSNA